MKNMRGFGSLGLLVGLGILLAVVGIGVVSYISAANGGARFENEIKARWENQEQILGQYSLKVKEAARVPGLQTENLKSVMQAAFSGRYGADGSQAVFQMIKEAYPGQVDPQLYRQIQQIVEAGRNKFENEQTAFIDVKRSYQNSLDYVWSGFWLGLAGYPKIDLSKYKTISSEHAQDAFATGVDKGVSF